MRLNIKYVMFTLVIICLLNINVYGTVTQLTSGWEYAATDTITDNTIWAAINSPSNIPNRGSQDTVWFRVPLPAEHNANLALHCSNIDQCFSVCIDGKDIYSYGSKQDYLSVYGSHIIPLPAHKDSWVYIKVFSNWDAQAAADGFAGFVKVGQVFTI